MAEKSLKKIMYSKLTLVFVILTLIIVLLVLAFVNGFIKNTIYSYLYNITFESVYSTLEQFDDSLHFLEKPYDNLLEKIVTEYKTSIEGESLDQWQMSNNLQKVLNKYREDLNILEIEGRTFVDVYYYIINQEGEIEQTNHWEQAGDIKNNYQYVKGFKNNLIEDVDNVVLQRLCYYEEMDMPRKNGYIRLPDNKILMVSLPINTELYNKMNLKMIELKNNMEFLEDIAIYRGLDNTMSNLYSPLVYDDIQHFQKVDNSNDFVKKDNTTFSSSFYAKVNADNTEEYLPSEPYYIKMRVNFTDKLKYISIIISIFICISLIAVVIIVLFFNRHLSKKITSPFIQLAENMNKLGSRDFSELNKSLERTDIKEVNMLLASYQEMTSELSSTFQELKAINEELEESYEESYNLAENLNNVINVATKLTDAVFENKEKFLQDLFYVAKKIIPEADYGSVYIVNDTNQIKYIESIGHDLEKIQQLPLTVEYLNSCDDVNYIENVEEEDYDPRFSQIREKILDAKKPVKSTLTVQLYIGESMAGGLCYDIAKDSNDKFSHHSIETIKAFGSLATAFLTMQRYKNIHEKFQREIILAIINILEIHDSYTKGHSENVSRIASMLAREMGFSIDQVKVIEWAALVHDIGKILVSKKILNKPGLLTAEEYEEIKKHTIWGYEVLIGSEELNDIGIYVRHHHERWDGEGYPDHLKGEEIPLFSRIIALADSWDTMRSDRVYRSKLSKDTAIQELVENKGKQFDPQVVEVALKLIEEGRLG